MRPGRDRESSSFLARRSDHQHAEESRMVSSGSKRSRQAVDSFTVVVTI